jgi:hypothetical protein
MRMSKSQVNVAREMFESLAYEAELDCYVRKARKILAACGCTVKKNGPYVTLFSPTTGFQTLTMARGVRPVSDLMAHVTGFAANQAGVFETAEDRRVRAHLAAELAAPDASVRFPSIR